jgi:hypothetical protein
LSLGLELLNFPLKLLQLSAFKDGQFRLGAAVRFAVLDQPVAPSLGADP